MPQPIEFRIRAFGIRGWLMILVSLSVFLAIIVAIAVVAVGVFLFLLPVMAVSVLVYYLFGRPKSRRPRGQGTEPMIIDGEFRHVDEPEIDQPPPR